MGLILHLVKESGTFLEKVAIRNIFSGFSYFPGQQIPLYALITTNIQFFSFGATAHIWALAYLHETFRFTSVY
jgi:hypothetical protein